MFGAWIIYGKLKIMNDMDSLQNIEQSLRELLGQVVRLREGDEHDQGGDISVLDRDVMASRLRGIYEGVLGLGCGDGASSSSSSSHSSGLDFRHSYGSSLRSNLSGNSGACDYDCSTNNSDNGIVVEFGVDGQEADVDTSVSDNTDAVIVDDVNAMGKVYSEQDIDHWEGDVDSAEEVVADSVAVTVEPEESLLGLVEQIVCDNSCEERKQERAVCVAQADAVSREQTVELMSSEFNGGSTVTDEATFTSCACGDVDADDTVNMATTEVVDVILDDVVVEEECAVLFGQQVPMEIQRKFVRELFLRDTTFFAREIAKLEAMETFDLALIYISEHYNWPAHSATAQEFIALLAYIDEVAVSDADNSIF